jgi:hypothetical protein
MQKDSQNILGTTLHAFNAMLLIHSRASCVCVYVVCDVCHCDCGLAIQGRASHSRPGDPRPRGLSAPPRVPLLPITDKISGRSPGPCPVSAVLLSPKFQMLILNKKYLSANICATSSPATSIRMDRQRLPVPKRSRHSTFQIVFWSICHGRARAERENPPQGPAPEPERCFVSGRASRSFLIRGLRL